MPVKLGPKPSSENEARIEIIPLIDIMFFLLASFMLVSLSMVNLKSVKVNLPTATTATLETRNDFVSISVDKGGLAYFDKQLVGANELLQRLVAWRKTKQVSEETYLRVKLDDPTLPQPIWGAMLEATEDGVARLLWRRDRKEGG